MFKINRILAIFIMILVYIMTSSCVKDDDFKVPNDLGNEENKGLEALLASDAIEVSMGELKLKYANNYRKPVLIETDIYIKGYVSSSDKEGNFFKEVFLQNTPENPTAGIKVILNQVETYNQYNFGREVYIKLKGLFIGEERIGNGVITIGGETATDQYGTTVQRLTENQRAQHIFRSKNTLELTPLVLTFSEVSPDHLGLYVQFNNVEFAENLEGERYYDPIQDFDTLREMQACTNDIGYSKFSLETSSFATFKDILLPLGNGTIKGVITKTFDGSTIVLALNNLSGVKMDDSRCTPLSIEDFGILFKEDFDLAIDDTDLDFDGWTNFAQAGKVLWKESSSDGNGYAEFNPLGSGNASNIGWLITPRITRDSHSYTYLNFKAAQNEVRSASNTLEVLISTDFDGSNVLSATWHPLDAFLPSQTTPSNEFVDSGLIDLSSYGGILYIAFKVKGNGRSTSLSGAYLIDDVFIFEKE
ncbi:DUF5689 domain-containing protein [Gelidibacter maritimus]|uniref:Choice-of-anchor J domain-containing protein n=1 Tax=Gelidibacter maritimus TaxID=2761487 RepID=A0A7W2R394_9FLAO|nr:DUF5689 domain-containing protein [Gelidibacter maritimus]MBA6151765.1 choice-of-anchor J domain-containing protein [Gelidibacter maritimus]